MEHDVRTQKVEWNLGLLDAGEVRASHQSSVMCEHSAREKACLLVMEYTVGRLRRVGKDRTIAKN
eukprot:2852050-Amphidinium_carterae.1